MAYVAPDPCGGVEFSQIPGYVPPDPCGGVIFEPVSTVLVVLSDATTYSFVCPMTTVSGGQVTDLPFAVGTGSIRFPWQRMDEKIEIHNRFLWDEADKIDFQKRVPWEKVDKIDNHTRILASYTEKIDKTYRSLWSNFSYWADPHTSFSFRVWLNYIDNSSRIPWNLLGFSDLSTTKIFRFPKPNDRHNRILWRLFDAKLSTGYEFPFKIGIPSDYTHRVFWGPYWYSLWCEKKYFPPDGCKGTPFTLDQDALPGVCEQINMYIGPAPNVRCPFEHKHSGIRDQYIKYPEPGEGPPFIPVLTVYYMINTATIKRVSDQAIIDFMDIQIQIDRDSWLWSFTFTVTDSSYLDLIKPIGSTYIEVEITVNDHKWICMVEGWNESKGFGEQAWSVSGRSPSVILDVPYNLPSSYTNTTDKQGAQLVTDILSLTGYSFDWAATDWLNPATQWLVPANIFSYSDSTKIDAIKSVAESVGHFVQTYQDTISDPKLIIQPKYPVQPWNFSTYTPDHIIIDAQYWEVGRLYEARSIVNAVIVSGVNAGVVCNVTRDGTAGDSYATMKTDSLITTTQAGSEAGRMILGDSGEWISSTIRLFSLYPPGQEPDLILPGNIIEATENASTWKGLVTGTTISVALNNDALDVSQTLEMEQYVGV